MLGDLVATGNTEIDAAFAYEGWDIGGGEEDKSDRMVLYKRNVQTRVAVELDVRAGEEVEASLVETSLWIMSGLLQPEAEMFGLTFWHCE